MYFIAINRQIKHTAVSADDGDNEQRTSEVAKEAEKPVSQHTGNADSTMSGGERGVLNIVSVSQQNRRTAVP